MTITLPRAVGNTYYNYDEQRDENESLPNINFRIEGKENVEGSPNWKMSEQDDRDRWPIPRIAGK